MEITISREHFEAKLQSIKADSLKVRTPNERTEKDRGYIDYHGVCISFHIVSDTTVKFLIVSRQDGIPASSVRSQILRWFN